MLQLQTNQLNYLNWLPINQIPKALCRKLCSVLQSKLQSTHHLATEVNFVKVKQLSKEKKKEQSNRWISCEFSACVNTLSECASVPDKMIGIVIWQHWLILLFLAASCNQQELTGRWEYTASVLHSDNVAPSARTAFVLTAPSRW